MKKLLFIALALLPFLFTGCEKEPALTTYQVFNNSIKEPSSIEYLDNTLYEVVVYCYVGNDIVRQDNYDLIAPGAKSPIKEVPSTYTKIKVSFKYLPPASPYYDSSTNNRLYCVVYTLITPEINTISEINDESMLSYTNKAPSIQNSKQMNKILFFEKQ